MKSRLIFGLILITLGISALTGMHIERYIGPLILIILGVSILTGSGHRQDGRQTGSVPQDTLNEVAVFSGVRKRIASTDFGGGKIVTIFGASEFDISEVKAGSKTVDLELVAIFGGLRLRIPPHWYVTSEVVGIAGGIDNRAKGERNATELHISGAAVLGGIEIVN